MEKFIIKGGKPLKGNIRISGAKNLASKVLIASLLTEEKCEFTNFPDIGDTDITFDLCSIIGSNFTVDGHKVSIETPKIKNTKVLGQSRKNRIPILALGPLLARCGQAEVPLLGGDKIGPRPVDIHIDALEKLGAEIEFKDKSYKAKAPNGLKGADIELRYPSVGATENTILAAVTAKGKTSISNAAVEPEIMSLIKFLQKMGAIIEIGTDRRIFIEGVDKLRGAKHRIIPDRNEAVSYVCLALATDGEIVLENVNHDHLITFLNVVRRIGAEYEVKAEGREIKLWRERDLKEVHIRTDTHPGFMTDWQQPLGILLTQVNGRSTIHETVYEDRFGYIEDLNKIGADIKVYKNCPEDDPCRFKEKGFYHLAEFKGSSNLQGSNMIVRDLRAGMANIIAALVAKGESVIEGVEEIDRGYESIETKLGKIGADIQRIDK